MNTRSLALLLGTLAPAAAFAADVPLPPPPAGTTLEAPAASGSPYRLAILGGFFSQDEHTSPSLQVDVGRDFTPAAWTRARFEVHLPVRAARPDWTGRIESVNPLTGVSTTLGTTADTVWLLEAIPSARLAFPVAEGFSVHVEAGVGVALTFERHVEDEMFLGKTTKHSLVLAPSISAALGLTYRLSDRYDVVFQPVILDRRGRSVGSSFSALWGLSYRL